MEGTCKIYVTDNGYECDNCGQIFGEMPFNYCPYCGASVEDVIEDRDGLRFRDIYRTVIQWAEGSSISRYEARKILTYMARANSLIILMHNALQRFCNEQDECCPLWLDRGKQCTLRDLEDKMRKIGFEVDDD